MLQNSPLFRQHVYPHSPPYNQRGYYGIVPQTEIFPSFASPNAANIFGLAMDRSPELSSFRFECRCARTYSFSIVEDVVGQDNRSQPGTIPTLRSPDASGRQEAWRRDSPSPGGEVATGRTRGRSTTKKPNPARRTRNDKTRPTTKRAKAGVASIPKGEAQFALASPPSDPLQRVVNDLGLDLRVVPNATGGEANRLSNDVISSGLYRPSAEEQVQEFFRAASNQYAL